MVFDLDGTLVSTELNGLIHVRPLAIEVLGAMHSSGEYKLVLWSAGEPDYVHFVAEHVLGPEVRQVEPNFAFDRILTAKDLDPNGIKDLNKVGPKCILVDDSLFQCEPNRAQGHKVILVKPFDHSKPDLALLCVMGMPIFKK